MTIIKNKLCPAEWGKSWRWLFLILFVSPLLPEYIAPFTVTIGYIIFLREQKKNRKKIKLGFQGKAEMLFLCYMLAAGCIWSATKLFSAAIAGLFLWMFLAGLMIAVLCTDKERLLCAVKYFVWSGGAAGAIGTLQLLSRITAKLLDIKSIVPDPFYRWLDTAVFRILPFSIKDRMFDDRSSGTFTNPNIYTTILVIALPFALYFLMRAVSKKERLLYFGITTAIACGVAASKSRIALAAVLLALILSLFCFGKKKAKLLIALIALACLVAVPMILSRFSGTLAKMDEITLVGLIEMMLGGKSSRTHIAIWEGCVDYLSKTPKAFWIGLGGGTENSWDIILNHYGINQPHAHNLVLELWMEYGLVGVLLFFTPIVIAIRNLVRIIRNKALEKEVRVLAYIVICAFLCYNLTGLTDYLFNSPKQVMLLFVLFGFAQAIYRIYGKPTGRAPAKRCSDPAQNK